MGPYKKDVINKFCVVKKSISNLSTKLHGYGGVNFVVMAVTEIWCFIFELNFKKIYSKFKTYFYI